MAQCAREGTGASPIQIMTTRASTQSQFECVVTIARYLFIITNSVAFSNFTNTQIVFHKVPASTFLAATVDSRVVAETKEDTRFKLQYLNKL